MEQQVRRVREHVRPPSAECASAGDLRHCAVLEASGSHQGEPAARVPRGERAAVPRLVRGEQGSPPIERGATGRWFVTPHAIDKWIARFTPRSFREAERTEEQRVRVLGWILDEAERARFVKALDTGVQLWRGPKPRRVRFIVTVCSEGTLPALLTVLPACDGWVR